MTDENRHNNKGPENLNEPVALDIPASLNESDALDYFFRLNSKVESKKILGSMYTVPPLSSIEAHKRFITSNLGNPGLYPGTVAIEKEVMNFIYSLVGAPENSLGRMLSGGTESNITSLWVCRNMNRNRQKAVLIPRTAHFSILKALDLLDISPVYIPLDEKYRIDAGSIPSLIEKHNPMGIVAVAGNTEFGTVDPVAEIAEACGGTYFHVDAAFGGFVIPFIKGKKEFGFRCPGVSSLTVDPHKMGMSTIPAGALILRDKDMWNYVKAPSPYLTEKENYGLLGTRGSGAVAGAFASIRHFGMKGYESLVSECMNVTHYFYKELLRLGIYVPVKPELNIVTFEIGDSVYNSLEKKGWILSKTMNGNFTRAVIMPHVTHSTAQDFIIDLEDSLKVK